MAIQNFLAGGYYGKLGATVGQRWKNKRTIRTYVIPHNPRTPTQQANRNKFANAVTFAQMGMQMNYYATCFDNPNFTHWNYRMKIARELKDSGVLYLDLIPLYPTTFLPPTLLTSFAIYNTSGQKHITFLVGNLNDVADRVLSLMFALFDENEVFLGYKLYLGYYYASNPGFLECDVDDIAEMNENCKVRIVSNDDEDSTTDMIVSPSLTVEMPIIPEEEFDIALYSFSNSGQEITIVFEQSIIAGVNRLNKFDGNIFYTDENGDMQIEDLSLSDLTFRNIDGYVGISFTVNENIDNTWCDFPASLTITEIEYGISTHYVIDEEVECVFDDYS